MAAEAFQRGLQQRKQKEQDELAAALAEEELQLVRELGEGGEGTTYLIEKSGERYAGKFLRVEEADPKALEKLLNEASVLQHLSHPRIPKYSGLVELPELGGILTKRKFIDDGNGRTSLRDLLQEKRALPEDHVAQVMDSVLEVLEYLHDPAQHPAFRVPIVHRDIKPDNVFVDRDNNAYLIDFGVARAHNQTTITAHLRGTHSYAAPEQYGGGGIPQSDLFGLGVTAIELLLGEVPAHFKKGYMLRDYQLPDNVGLNAAWKDVLPALVKLEPMERPQSASAVRAMLREKGLLKEKPKQSIDNIIDEDIIAIGVAASEGPAFLDSLPRYDLFGAHQRILGYTREDILSIADDLGFSRPKEKMEKGLIPKEELQALQNPAFRQLLQYCPEHNISVADLERAARNLRRYSKENDTSYDKVRFKENIAKVRAEGLETKTLPLSLEWSHPSLSDDTQYQLVTALVSTLAEEGIAHRDAHNNETVDRFTLKSPGFEVKQYTSSRTGILLPVSLRTGTLLSVSLVTAFGTSYFFIRDLQVESTLAISGFLISTGLEWYLQQRAKKDGLYRFTGSIIRTYSPEKKAAGLLQIYQAAETLQLPEETVPELIKDFGKKEKCTLTPHELCEQVYWHLSVEAEGIIKAFPGV